jgi:succinate dehydrogenase/fumarate reductase flavoprotein subunit
MIAGLLDRKGSEKIDRVRRNMQLMMMDYCSVFRDEEGLNEGILVNV